MESTKIFISSATQESLSTLRQDLSKTLKDLGHEPLLYEENFGPWSDWNDSIQSCIDRVKEADIFLLFIDTKSGSIDDFSRRSVTHLEFLEARKENKYILAFCEVKVKKTYLTSIRGEIKKFKSEFYNSNHEDPTLDDIYNFIQEDLSKRAIASGEVDPYVWLILYDIIDNNNIYVEDLRLGISTDWKQYFSKILRETINKYSKIKDINIKQLLKITDSYSLIISTLNHIIVSVESNLNRILTIVRDNLSEIEVIQNFQYTHRNIGTLKKCSAICLYEKKDNLFECIAFDGDTDGNKKFNENDRNSYIVCTYFSNNGEPDENNIGKLFYNEEKRIFYLLYKLNDYVIAYHYPEKSQWTRKKVDSNRQLIIESIIMNNTNTFVFINKVIERLWESAEGREM